MGSSQSKDQTCTFCIGRQIFYHLSHLESQLLLNCLLACCCFSHVWVFVTLWTVTCLASLFIGVSRQEYWSGFPCFPLGDLPTQGLNCISCVPCFSGRFFIHWATWEVLFLKSLFYFSMFTVFASCFGSAFRSIFKNIFCIFLMNQSSFNFKISFICSSIFLL